MAVELPLVEVPDRAAWNAWLEAHHASSLHALPLALLLGACAGEPDSGGPAPDDPAACAGPAWIEPVDGGVYDFAMPPFTWQAVDGASTYTVMLRADGVEVERAEGLVDPRWTPTLATPGAPYEVQVTADPGGATCSVAFTVRTLDAEPTATSPDVICGGQGGAGSGIAYAATWAGDRVVSTGNRDGLGLCAYDGSTLAFLDHFASQGDTFRSFGVTTDPQTGALLATVYPMSGQCGDSLERLLIVDDPNGARTVTTVETGMESGVSVAVVDGVAWLSALAGMSCLDEDSFCLDWGESCTFGQAELVAWDLGTGQRLYNSEIQASPGLAADDLQVFRAGLDASFSVLDPATGSIRLTVPVPASPRGLIRHDDPAGRRFLLVTDFDKGLRVYQIPDTPLTQASDLVEVLDLTTADRYWQGAVDADGRFVFPAQDAVGLARHDLRP